MKLTRPAKVVLVSVLIWGFALLLPFDVLVFDEEKGTFVVAKYNLSNRVVMLLLMAIPLALHVYSVNCMMVGKCVVWSWIVAVLYALWIGLFLLVAFSK